MDLPVFVACIGVGGLQYQSIGLTSQGTSGRRLVKPFVMRRDWFEIAIIAIELVLLIGIGYVVYRLVT